MIDHEKYIRRCFDLALLGTGNVSPNPLVGAVLVYENRIIGEGYHKKYGTAHAEVNALNSVTEKDRHLIPKSTLYVSLEPCCIFGKTPPCSNLIIENKIPKVVISCLDHTPKVAGNSVKILQSAGIEVITGVLEKEGIWISRFRNTFVKKNRPRVILKFAQTKNGFLGKENEQFWISNPASKRWVHQLRNEVDAILVGRKTAEIDNPNLTNRFYFGRSPIRIVFDRKLKLKKGLNIFDNKNKTFVINEKKEDLESENLKYIKLDFEKNFLNNFLKKCAENRIISLLVEGGKKTLNSFIEEKLWDEAYILSSEKQIDEGIHSPHISTKIIDEIKLDDNLLRIYENQ